MYSLLVNITQMDNLPLALTDSLINRFQYYTNNGTKSYQQIIEGENPSVLTTNPCMIDQTAFVYFVNFFSTTVDELVQSWKPVTSNSSIWKSYFATYGVEQDNKIGKHDKWTNEIENKEVLIKGIFERSTYNGTVTMIDRNAIDLI